MRRAHDAATTAAREAEASASASAACLREQASKHEREVALVRHEAAAELEAAQTTLRLLRLKHHQAVAAAGVGG